MSLAVRINSYERVRTPFFKDDGSGLGDNRPVPDGNLTAAGAIHPIYDESSHKCYPMTSAMLIRGLKETLEFEKSQDGITKYIELMRPSIKDMESDLGKAYEEADSRDSKLLKSTGGSNLKRNSTGDAGTPDVKLEKRDE